MVSFGSVLNRYLLTDKTENVPVPTVGMKIAPAIRGGLSLLGNSPGSTEKFQKKWLSAFYEMQAFNCGFRNVDCGLMDRQHSCWPAQALKD